MFKTVFQTRMTCISSFESITALDIFTLSAGNMPHLKYPIWKEETLDRLVFQLRNSHYL